jgi:hypothetical protein
MPEGNTTVTLLEDFSIALRLQCPDDSIRRFGTL